MPLNPWFIVGALILALLLTSGAFATGYHARGVVDDRAIAEQRATAANLLAKLTKEQTDRAIAAADFTATLDKKDHDNAAALAARSDALASDYARRVRALASRSRCPTPAGAEAANPGGAAVSASVGDDQLQRRIEDIVGRIKRIGDAADANAALIRDVCVPFAQRVGR